MKKGVKTIDCMRNFLGSGPFRTELTTLSTLFNAAPASAEALFNSSCEGPSTYSSSSSSPRSTTSAWQKLYTLLEFK